MENAANSMRRREYLVKNKSRSEQYATGAFSIKKGYQKLNLDSNLSFEFSTYFHALVCRFYGQHIFRMCEKRWL